MDRQRREAMENARTQCDRLLIILSDFEWHRTTELHDLVGWRYGARLWDLRQQGCRMEKRPTEDRAIEEWRLVGIYGEKASEGWDRITRLLAGDSGLRVPERDLVAQGSLCI